ncbi:MAG: NUDIX domain-containing protein [Ignavibacteriales bacterium]|nr:NUDIX domain-containing protein [Ignavibacteriales bacterium]
MPREISAGAIIVRKTPEGHKYLLLHYELGHWEFAKGHIEPGEDERETVKREVAEETGITDILFVDGFRETIRYFFRWKESRIFKIVVFFLVQTSQEVVKLSDEHIGYEWLSYDDALKRLKFKNSKTILEKAKELLLKRG